MNDVFVVTMVIFVVTMNDECNVRRMTMRHGSLSHF